MAVGQVLSDAPGAGRDARGALQVLVVGDGGVLTEALTRLLRGAGVTAVHAKAAHVEMALVRHRPEAVLLEGGLGQELLVEVAELARRHCPAARVLLLAASDEDDELADRLEAAAVFSGWSSPGELVSEVSGAPREGKRRRRPAQRVRGRKGQLTARETQVLRALMAGGSSVQVAEALHISPHTVRTHVQNILGKLNARNRLEAATIGFRWGLRPLGEFRLATPQAQ